ncbi:MAG: Crp/Fnr family transcriptional regulator [Thermonemataceae bacterium]|nr:Crp/Fnr family transcriptional regulator [Thermonemataceae bacterium]
MEKLSGFFQSFGETTRHKILSLFHRKELVRGEYFVRTGKINTHLAFVEEGVFQFFLNHERGEVTVYLAMGNYFIASIESFLNQIPSKENIRALTSAIVWLISKHHFDELLRECAEFKTFYIQLLEHHIICVDNNRRDLICMTAEERYEKLLIKEPNLLQKIPLQYLASILGITPRHLSRIRRNIQQK